MKYSKQRQQILEFVKSVDTHPTAEVVYSNLRSKISNLSLGTVYRNLDVLSKLGKLRRIEIANDKDRFDGNLSSHCHALCFNCGKVFDINVESLSKVNMDVEKILQCKILSDDIVFNILCSNCK